MSFLGVRITPDVSRLLSNIEVPGDKVDLSSLHITLLCFEDNPPIHKLAAIFEIAYEVISKQKPFLVKTNEIDYFPIKKENNLYPVIAKIQSKELCDLNKELKSEFDKNKIDYLNNFKEYKSHITLAWSEEEPEAFEIDEVDFYVNEIILFGGNHGDDRVFITFPLKAPTKKACILKKINEFQKLATI